MSTFVGNITEPQLTFTQGGTAKLEFRLPVDKRRKNRDTGEWETVYTSWWGVTLWGDQATNAQPLLHKGTRVVVVGEPVARPYEDNTGAKRVSPEIEVEHVGVLIPRKASGQSVPAADSWTPAPVGGGDYGDSTPF